MLQNSGFKFAADNAEGLREQAEREAREQAAIEQKKREAQEAAEREAREQAEREKREAEQREAQRRVDEAERGRNSDRLPRKTRPEYKPISVPSFRLRNVKPKS